MRDDVIMSVAGERTLTAEILVQKLLNHILGDVVKLGIKRGDKFGRAEMRLRAR